MSKRIRAFGPESSRIAPSSVACVHVVERDAEPLGRLQWPDHPEHPSSLLDEQLNERARRRPAGVVGSECRPAAAARGRFCLRLAAPLFGGVRSVADTAPGAPHHLECGAGRHQGTRPSDASTAVRAGAACWATVARPAGVARSCRLPVGSAEASTSSRTGVRFGRAAAAQRSRLHADHWQMWHCALPGCG
jgi:hypothetical protein